MTLQRFADAAITFAKAGELAPDNPAILSAMRFLLPLFLMLAGCAAPAPPPPQTTGDIPVSFDVVPVGRPSGGFGDASDRPVLPASTLKIITATAVLVEGDPHRRFLTRLCRTGGDLVLIGESDPALDVEDLLALALAADRDLSGAQRFLYAPDGVFGPVHGRESSK